MPGKYWIAMGALLAGLAVTAGAVGTHYLKEKLELPAKDLETYDLAVRYHLAHALALVLVGILAASGRWKFVHAAGTLFLLGIVLFSGGLYGWIFAGLPLIHVVPLGGLAWIVGWLVLACGAALSNNTEK